MRGIGWGGAVEASVVCGGMPHTIRCVRGRLVLTDHAGERDADDALVALSGERAVCRDIETAWASLRNDRALELARADDVAIDQIARRLPVALELRARVVRRDDIPADRRAAVLAGFDQTIFLAKVALLGPSVARVRGELARRHARTFGRVAGRVAAAA
jgi:hypothetical protein